jgi:hypothetical protein
MKAPKAQIAMFSELLIGKPPELIRVERQHYRTTAAAESVTITGLPALVTRAVWV